MSSHVDVLASTALAIVILMVVAWLISLPAGNASIVHGFWGLGFVLIGWVAWAVGDGDTNRSDLLVAMVSIWGVRHSVHAWYRNLGQGEDHHHRSMRQRTGANFAIFSLFTVFLSRGAVVWVVSLPIQLAVTPLEPRVSALAIVGVAIWGVGFFFATVGDAQLARFRADPTNDGKVLDWGLWRYTRHPNYFGDFCVWWGIWLVAAETPDARIGVVGPLLMSVLLLRNSGIRILKPQLHQPTLHQHRVDYDDYVARTSPFIPRTPRPS